VVEKLEDILTRFGNKIVADDLHKAGQGARSRLLPDRHPTPDFFVADILDWALKDDRHSMEHPIFSLSKNRDLQVRHYEHNGNSITVKPGADGLATIWDKDVLIYLVSQLVEGLNQGREDAKSRKIRFRAYDYLVSTNRPIGGEHYKTPVLRAEIPRLPRLKCFEKAAAQGVPVYDVDDARADRAWHAYEAAGKEITNGKR
jgi:Replication initiator protein A